MMTRPSENIDNEAILMERLKDIILREDRDELEKIKVQINDDELFAAKATPIVEEHLNFLKENFKNEYAAIINQMIDEKLKDSQEQIINAIYPAMGTMVKKFIVNEFQKLKESLERTVSKTNPINRFRSFFSSKKDNETILTSLDKATIQEIYIIQRDSGILIGTASLKKTVDQDVIAGMLTAIKSFVEDAFKQSNQELQMIEYGTYKIFIQSFYTYYVAVAISGSLSALERDNLSTDLFKFAEQELSSEVHKLNGHFSEQISEKLKLHFFEQKPQLKN